MTSENLENAKVDAKKGMSDIGNKMAYANADAKADIKANAEKAKSDLENRIVHAKADLENKIAHEKADA